MNKSIIKDICFLILNKEDLMGDIVENVKLPYKFGTKLFDAPHIEKCIGKAYNFKKRKNKVYCDIEINGLPSTFTTTLSWAHKPIKFEIKKDKRIINNCKLYFMFLTNNHAQEELDNNLIKPNNLRNLRK